MHIVRDLRGYVRLGGGIAVHLVRVLSLGGVPLCTLHVFYVLTWLLSIATFDFQHASECFRMHQIASECFRMHHKGSERIRMLQDASDCREMLQNALPGCRMLHML